MQMFCRILKILHLIEVILKLLKLAVIKIINSLMNIQQADGSDGHQWITKRIGISHTDLQLMILQLKMNKFWEEELFQCGLEQHKMESYISLHILIMIWMETVTGMFLRILYTMDNMLNGISSTLATHRFKGKLKLLSSSLMVKRPLMSIIMWTIT